MLFIITLVTTTALAALRGPSPELLLRQEIAGVSAQIAHLRLSATRLGQMQTLQLDELACGTNGSTVFIHSDGMVTGDDLCFSHGDTALRFRSSPLTGKLNLVELP